MFKAWKVIYQIQEGENTVPFIRTYWFSCQEGKKNAKRIANDIIREYINDMGFYTGSIKTITEIK